MRRDLNLWLSFLANFNGKFFFLHDFEETSDTLHLFTDAAESFGFAAVLGSKWFVGDWPPAWREYNIVILELLPIVLAVELWGPLLAKKRIISFTDNQALVYILNKQSTPDQKTMILVRRLVLACLRFNLTFKSRHVPGKSNSAADALSRFQVDQFRQLVPWAEPHPTAIPPLPAFLR